MPSLHFCNEFSLEDHEEPSESPCNGGGLSEVEATFRRLGRDYYAGNELRTINAPPR